MLEILDDDSITLCDEGNAIIIRNDGVEFVGNVGKIAKMFFNYYFCKNGLVSININNQISVNFLDKSFESKNETKEMNDFFIRLRKYIDLKFLM